MSDATRRPARRVLLALFALFAVGIALQLHGYSISAWRQQIDDSPPDEILLGKARLIRSDDWNVIIPLSLAQRAHDPPFPVVNELIGLGENALVPFALPVAHPLTLFRPATWGWFIGPDVGLAWQWWSQLLGLLAALALFFRMATPSADASQTPIRVALAAAVLAVGSPFVLFWSLRSASVPAFGALAAVGALGIATARRPAAILGFGALLGWAGGCFALELYPPFQVPTALLLGVIVLALLHERRSELQLRSRGAFRLAALAAGVAIPFAALAWLFLSAGDAIDALRNTSFPGRRVNAGGERALFELVGANLALAWRVESWGPLLNVCESAGFFVLGVPLAAAAILRRSGRGLGAVEVAAIYVVIVLVAHAVAGYPSSLASATGLALVPGRRSMVAIGIADALLAARLMGRPGGVGAGRVVAITVGAGWAALLALAASRAADALPEYPLPFGIGLAVCNGALVAWAASARRGFAPLAAAAVASIAVSAWFNPLVRGGSDFLRDNPLAREVIAIDAARGGESIWVSFGDQYLPNLFRAVGVDAINGLHPIPQPALWSRLDPHGVHRGDWNRYAHVTFVAWAQDTIDVRLHSTDTLVVSMNPRAQVLRELGVTHMLIETDDPATFARVSGHEQLASFGRLHVFEARWPATPDPQRAPPAGPE